MTKYAHEILRPGVPACKKSAIQLYFDGKTFRIQSSIGTLKSYPAVSGRSVNGSFDYSNQRQRVANQGPIPEGNYWINPSDLWTNTPLKNILRSPRSAWGDHRIAIRVYPGTNTHGRGGFFIHGGDTPGSAGCIDLTHAMNDFVKDLKQMLGNQTDCHIHLAVEYSNAP
ncbi:tlde1 domain-containing protein [Limnobacter sp.]|uniref:tlde1 domain-containing protein n=1 Tax=Limnobacter sp. TaxID=2003368 RepID=UPI003517F163